MGQILGFGWGGRGQIPFPLDCPSMTSSKGDRTLFAELGGLVVLVPCPRKRLSGTTPAWDRVPPAPDPVPTGPRMGALALAQPLQRVCPCPPPLYVGIFTGVSREAEPRALGCSWDVGVVPGTP